MKHSTKKLLILFFLILNASSFFGQSTVMFWTRHDFGKIKIYYNGNYAGTITTYYDFTPSCGALGCVIVAVKGTNNTWYATAEDGSEWTSTRITLNAECTRIELQGTPKARNNNSQSSDSANGYTPSGNSSNSNSYEEAQAMAAGVAIAAVGVAAVGVATDAYFFKAESSNYNGYAFGLRNTLNKHIDVEYGTSFYRGGKGLIDIKPFKTHEINDIYTNHHKSLWAIDINALYNIKKREDDDRPIFNPYFGFGVMSFVDNSGGTGFGGIVGFSYGKRLCLHVRYKWMKHFEHNRMLANQLEIGLSYRYQDRLFFKKKK